MYVCLYCSFFQFEAVCMSIYVCIIYIFLYYRMYNDMYLSTNKAKNMTKITIRLMNFVACNVNQFHIKLDGALYCFLITCFPFPARQIRRWLDPVSITPDMLSDDGHTQLTALAHTAEVSISIMCVFV